MGRISGGVPVAFPAGVGVSAVSAPAGTGREPGAGAVRRRLRGLDAFRGCLVVLRVFIGSQVAELASPVLLHADGFGLTVADLVAPGFLFIMGMAVPVSMSAFLRPAAERPARRRPYLLRIGRRSALLCAIGLFLNAYPFLPEEVEHLRYAEAGGVRRRAGLLLGVGVAGVVAGLALGAVVPVGKQLWTPSYALVTIGIMALGFGLVLLVFDGGLRPAAGRVLAPVGGALVALGADPRWRPPALAEAPLPAQPAAV